MALAIRMAERGQGATAPNPSVGAVLVRPDPAGAIVLSRAWTAPGGRPHAETQVIAKAGGTVRGATLYVTLEPCAHHGKTPPCADAIVAAGLARVVIGTSDPDPRTSGQGTARLRAAGIEVVENVLRAEARQVTLGHILRQTAGRPFVQLKMALDARGEIARGMKGEPVWVTGPEARAMGHLLRAEADAILAGAGTVRDDNPELNCRLPGLAGRTPLRIVLDATLSMSPGARMLATAARHPVWIFHAEPADRAKAEALRNAGARLVVVPQTAGHLDLRRVLAFLAGEGMTRLIVEGGPAVWRSFLETGLVDEIVCFRQGPAAFDATVLSAFGAPAQVVLVSDQGIGSDRVGVFRPGRV